MPKKTVGSGVRPLSTWYVAVTLRDTGTLVHPCAKKSDADRQVRRIVQVLRMDLGPNAPARFVQQSAKSYYKSLCALSSSLSQPAKTKPCEG
jgi:hypothetical protein